MLARQLIVKSSGLGLRMGVMADIPCGDVATACFYFITDFADCVVSARGGAAESGDGGSGG